MQVRSKSQTGPQVLAGEGLSKTATGARSRRPGLLLVPYCVGVYHAVVGRRSAASEWEGDGMHFEV